MFMLLRNKPVMWIVVIGQLSADWQACDG